VFATPVHFYPFLIFAGKAGAFHSGAPYGSRFLDLAANISLEWKGVAVANTLAYYYTTTITGVKSFIDRSK
jgi:hypothetical protein